jgi:hypothetical protein
MAVEQEMRRRAERLLHGPFDKFDLSTLISFLRGKWYNRQCAREIGHFLAHPEDRDQGIVTERARAFFTVIRFSAPLMMGRGLGPVRFDPNSLPSLFPAAVKHTLDLLDPNTLRQRTGFRRKQAKPALASILSRLTPNPDGTLKLAGPVRAEEARLLECLASTLVVKCAFTDKELLQDFWFLFVKEKLAREEDKQAFMKRGPAIVLFAICCMHQRTLLLDEQPTAILETNCSQNPENPLAVNAIANVPGLEKYVLNCPAVNFSAAMFSTTLVAKDHCEEELIRDAHSGWNYPIELSQNLKLARL